MSKIEIIHPKCGTEMKRMEFEGFFRCPECGIKTLLGKWFRKREAEENE